MDEPKKVSLLKEIPREVIETFNPSFVANYSIMPIGFVINKEGLPAIEVAFGEGTLEGNIKEIIDDIQFMTRRELVPVYAPQREIDLAIEKYYGVGRDEDMLHADGCMRKE